MIKYIQGNLLADADQVDAMVNTVNTVGVMGAGIALMFKKRYPKNFEAYKKACKEGKVRIGKMFVTENNGDLVDSGPKFIINFPTKKDWRKGTEIQWVEEGLEDLVHTIKEKGIRSIAIPQLGCGNGGLDWYDVKPRIEAALKEAGNITATIYEPTAEYAVTPKAESRRSRD